MSETNNSYIAITIGPIGEMMGLVTKPAALWGASYIFSYISRHLCELIVNKGVAVCEDIITPFFPKNEEPELYKTLLERKDGVGLFHDHIIVRASYEKNKEKMKQIRREVLEDTAKIIYKDKCTDSDTDILEKYIMIAICGFDKQDSESNAIMYCGKMLDSLELPKRFSPQEKVHPILSHFQSDESNWKLKAIAEKFGVNFDEWQLTFNENQKERLIRDLPDIAAASHTPLLKKNKYYCVLRSDGDNISKIIENRKDDGDCREFSRVCLEYCSDVADAVKQYGGVTIYAGGDDLLALVPCQGKKPKIKDVSDAEDNEAEIITVLELTNTINKIFKTKFNSYIEEIEKENLAKTKEKDKKPIPTLSYGIFICYKKFPLYEALERSASLLFGVAKNTEEKNCVAINLQKHSGQSEEFVISNHALSDTAPSDRSLIFKVFDSLLSSKSDEDETILLSASNKILLFKKLLAAASNNRIYNIFENIFDDEYHLGTRSDFLHKDLPKIYCEYCVSGLISLYENDEKVKNADNAKTLAQLIRFMKFFVEKSDETEKYDNEEGK